MVVVYILYGGHNYEESSIFGVFWNIEDAHLMQEWHEAGLSGNRYDNYYIQPMLIQ